MDKRTSSAGPFDPASYCPIEADQREVHSRHGSAGPVKHNGITPASNFVFEAGVAEI